MRAVRTTHPERPGRREAGQAVPLIVAFAFAMIAVAGLAIDVGAWYQQRRAVQAAADAAALAGASELPVGWSQAQTTAKAQYAKNGIASDTVSVTQSTNLTGNDSVTVTATRRASTFFVSIFGLDSVQVSATARATVESYVSTGPSTSVMPFGVMKGNYTLGQSYTIYGDGSSSNNGALSLDLQSGAGCSSANGASDLRNTISGASGVCSVAVNQLVSTKPGNNTGPVAQGLNSRMSAGWKTFNEIVQVDGNGQYTLLDAQSPQLVLIPIVLNTNGSTTWPNGSSQVKVVGFAWFVITGCGNPSRQGSCRNSDGKYVNGTFVGLMNNAVAGATGAWTPGTTSADTYELTQ
jgi:Flp pilus assembly protein TadG